MRGTEKKFLFAVFASAVDAVSRSADKGKHYAHILLNQPFYCKVQRSADGEYPHRFG